MRITDIHIDGFGIFHNKDITGFTKGINVLYGPNEVGKSTLLDFLRFTLFGYPRTQADRRPPLRGGIHGGRVALLSSSGDELNVHRRGNHIVLIDVNGVQLDNANSYHRLMGNATIDLYQNVYAITLDELISIGKLSDSGMEDRIFSMGMGLSGVDFGAFERELITQSERYYLPRGKNQVLIEIVNKIEEKEAEISKIQQKLSEYNRLTEHKKVLESELTDLDNERTHLAQQATKLSGYERAYPHFVAYLSAQQIIDSYGEFQLFPKETIADFRIVQAQVKSLDNTILQLEAEEKSLVDEREKASIDTTLFQHLDLLDFLKSNLKMYEESEIKREQEKLKINAAERSIQELMSQLDDALSVDDIVNLSGTFDLRQLAVKEQEKVSQSRQELERIRIENRQNTSNITAIEEQLKSVNNEFVENGVPSKEAANKMQQMFIELDTQFQKTLAGTVAKPIGNGVVVIGLIASIGLMLAGVFLFNVYWLYSIVFALIGLGSTLLLLLNKRKNHNQTIVPTNGNELNSKLKEIESKLERYKQLSHRKEELESQLNTLFSFQSKLDEEAKQVESQLSNFDSKWKLLLESKKLPSSITPRSMENFLAIADEIKRQHQTKDEALDHRARLNEVKIDFENKIHQIVSEQDVKSTKDIYSLLSALDLAKVNKEKLDRWNEQLWSIRQNIATKRSELQILKKNINEVFQLVNVPDETELFAHFEKQEIYLKAMEQMRSAKETVESIAGKENFDETLNELKLIEPSQVNVAALHAKQAADNAHELYMQKSNELVTCQTEIRHILEPDQMYSKLNEREVLETKLYEQTKEWLATKMALAILVESKQRFEKEKQPEVITFTRNYFKEITENAYQDLRISLSDKHVSIIDRAGKTKTVEELSRGTREQLLLALRMGLIEEYEKNSEPLPVALDDVMVNFDVHRSRNLAQTLTHFANNRQVILFTCHEHTRDLFKEYNATILEW